MEHWCMPAHDSPTVAARRARLQEWINTHHGGSQASFVAATKINQGELSLLLKNKSFGEKKAEALETAAGMPRGYLVNPLPAAQNDDWEDVTGFAQAVGLGFGTEAQEYAEAHSLKFKASSLRKRGILGGRLAVYYGKGDSMEPTIKDGDAILFDESDTRVLDGRLYVVQSGKEIYVKRAEILDDVVYFRSDNPNGDHAWRKPRRMDNKKSPISVIGRVHWIGSWAD